MDHKAVYYEALSDFKSDNLDQAVSKLEEVLKADPRFEDAYEALTVILYTQKKHDEAILVIKRWIQTFPKSHMAQTNLSRCYVAKGMILEAEAAQAEARKLTWMAELKEKKLSAPKVDYKEKIERYKQVIELDPKDVLGYFSLGTAYQDAGMKREAVDTFAKAIDTDPNHSSSYFGYGQALEALGDKTKAAFIYTTGIKVAEKNGDVLSQKRMESCLRKLSEEKP